jgi:flagellar motor switch protein FliN/FliY
MSIFDDEDSLNNIPEDNDEEMVDDSGFEDIVSQQMNDEPVPQQQSSTVTAQPVKFASFEDLDSANGTTNQNLGILLDVKLQLTVELGKTELPIKKVLELTKGSVVTLDKVAGEPVELYANGKLIAHGEVVVIEDNFGLRITHITSPTKRIDTFSHMPHETVQSQGQ